MHRPRYRRKDPKRTGPIRNAGEAWRKREPPEDPWEPKDDDPASYGVRVGSSVIDEQIRRGRRMAQDLHREPRERSSRHGGYRHETRYEDEEPRYRQGYEPWPAGDRRGRGLFGMPVRHLERLLREILHQIVSVRPNPWRLAELLLQLQIEAISELARLGFGALGMLGPCGRDSFEEDVERVERDIDETLDEIEEEIDEEILEDELFDWPPVPSTLTTIKYTQVPIPIYVVSHKLTEVDLDLPAGAQYQELEVEPLVVTGTDHPVVSAPAFEAEFVALVDGPLILRIEVPRELPEGTYVRRILDCATGEPVGKITVGLLAIPKSPIPKKPRKKR